MQQDFKANEVNDAPKRHYTGLIIAVIAAVILIPSAMYVVKHIQSSSKSHAKRLSLVQASKKSDQHQIKKNGGGQFDFYSLLPQMSVKEQSSANTASTQASFVLQVASIKNPNHVTELRNKLGALGITATIQKVPNSGWYRVLAGPYHSASAAKQDQKRLKQQHINSLLIANKS